MSNYVEYMNYEINEELYENGVVVKRLREVCKFLPISKRNTMYGNKVGLYPFFKSSSKINSYVNQPDYNEESLIIGKIEGPIIYCCDKFSTNKDCCILQVKNKLLLDIKYVYYYLYNNLDMMKQLYTGNVINFISKINIENIKIPIPSLEFQKKIVEYYEYNN
jgi:type I restriction enzyme S subunit